jgi:hypothetical protein
MTPTQTQNPRLATRGAFAGAALFVVLIVIFSSLKGQVPAPGLLLTMGLVGAASHLVLLPVVAELPAPVWARVCGYGWLLFDVALNVATVNGADMHVVSALRLGGHVPAGLWLSIAAYGSGGSVRALGVPLGAMLIVHAFLSPQLPAWAIFIPFVLIPVWFTLVGLRLRRGAPVPVMTAA